MTAIGQKRSFDYPPYIAYRTYTAVRTEHLDVGEGMKPQGHRVRSLDNENRPILDQPGDRLSRVPGVSDALVGAVQRQLFRRPRPEAALRVQGGHERRGDRGLHRVSGSLRLRHLSRRHRFRSRCGRRRPAGDLFTPSFPPHTTLRATLVPVLGRRDFLRVAAPQSFHGELQVADALRLRQVSKFLVVEESEPHRLSLFFFHSD